VYTKEGTLLGTPAYMAPEQAKGAKSIDHRIDIYAMGVILYEIMTGQKPFKGETPKETVYKIITKPYLSPGRINPAINQDMEKVIIKAMAKDPRARFASALEMQRAFRQAVGTPSFPPSRATSAPTAISESTRSFTPAALEATGGKPRPSGAVRRESRPPKLSGRRKALIVTCLGVAALMLIAALIWAFNREKATPVVVPLATPTRASEPE
jgi:serine/threonine protein kinase